MRRKKKERRFNLAAACMVEWTSSGFQPQRVKNSGPCSGANRNGAPAWSRGVPIFLANIRNSAGEAKSMIQC